jgi:hypothetical protein
MGKSGTELPDSLDPAPAESAEKVDDLLAQMAGEEIDRLLSEADDPREPSRAKSTPVTGEPPIDRQLDALFSGSDGDAEKSAVTPTPVAKQIEEAKPTIAPVPEVTTSSDDEVSRQLNDLFSDAEPAVVPAASETQTDIASTATEAVAESNEKVGASDATATIGSDEAVLSEAPTSAAERAALEAPPSEEDQLKLQLGDDERSKASLYSKSMEWISGPADGSPDTFRDLVGKIALLTLFNATAVLIYVFLFRKHH